jgi:hypothetical protein
VGGFFADLWHFIIGHMVSLSCCNSSRSSHLFFNKLSLCLYPDRLMRKVDQTTFRRCIYEDGDSEDLTQAQLDELMASHGSPQAFPTNIGEDIGDWNMPDEWDTTPDNIRLEDVRGRLQEALAPAVQLPKPNVSLDVSEDPCELEITETLRNVISKHGSSPSLAEYFLDCHGRDFTRAKEAFIASHKMEKKQFGPSCIICTGQFPYAMHYLCPTANCGGKDLVCDNCIQRLDRCPICQTLHNEFGVTVTPVQLPTYPTSPTVFEHFRVNANIYHATTNTTTNRNNGRSMLIDLVAPNNRRNENLTVPDEVVTSTIFSLLDRRDLHRLSQTSSAAKAIVDLHVTELVDTLTKDSKTMREADRQLSEVQVGHNKTPLFKLDQYYWRRSSLCWNRFVGCARSLSIAPGSDVVNEHYHSSEQEIVNLGLTREDCRGIALCPQVMTCGTYSVHVQCENGFSDGYSATGCTRPWLHNEDSLNQGEEAGPRLPSEGIPLEWQGPSSVNSVMVTFIGQSTNPVVHTRKGALPGSTSTETNTVIDAEATERAYDGSRGVYLQLHLPEDGSGGELRLCRFKKEPQVLESGLRGPYVWFGMFTCPEQWPGTPCYRNKMSITRAHPEVIDLKLPVSDNDSVSSDLTI